MADIAELLIEVGSTQVAEAVDELKRLASGAEEAEQKTMNLTSAAQALATSWAALKVWEMGQHVAELAMRYEMLGATMTVMANNVGITGEKMAEYQRDLENTGISMLQARKGLQVMAAAHVDLSRAADLGRVAQDAATLAGINSSEAFNNLVRGLSTGETRIIRHMGIMVNFKNAVSDYALANHKAVQSLTPTEIAQARMNAVLEEGGKRAGVYEAAMTTAGKQLLSMQRYIENAQVQFGTMFNSAANGLIFEMAERLKEATESLKAWYASGEGEVFASNLRHGFMTVIELVEKATKFIWDHATAVTFLAGIYASFKISGFLVEMGKGIAVLYAKAMAHQRVALASAEESVIVAKGAVSAAASASMELALEESVLGKKFQSNATYQKMAAERISMNQRVAASEAEVAVAVEAVTAAQSIQAKMASSIDAGIRAMGGPIATLITLLGAAVVAWQLFKDKTSSTVSDSIKASKDHVEQLMREMAQTDRFFKLLAQGKTPEEAKKGSWSVSDEPGVIERNARITELSAKMFEIMALRNELGSYETMAPELVSTASSYDKDIATKKGEIEYLQRQRNVEAEAIVVTRNMKNAEQDINIARRKIDPERPIPEHENRSAESMIANINKEIYISKQKGLDLDKEAFETVRQEAEYIKREEIIENDLKAVDAKGRAKMTNAEALAARNANSARLEEAYDAEKRTRAERLRTESDAEATSETNSILKRYEDIKRANEEFSKPVRTVAQQWKDSVPGIKQTDAAVIEFNANVEKTLNLEKERLRVTEQANSVKGLNKTYADEANALKLLNERRASAARLAGDGVHESMLPEVYREQWTKIMLASDSALGMIVKSTKNATQLMSNAFVQFAETGKFNFKSFAKSLLDDMLKTMSDKVFQDFFKYLMGVMSNNSGDGSLGGLLGGLFGGGGTSTGTLPAMSAGDLDIGWGGAFAGGGFTPGMAPILVGENGPEIFTPGVSGNITPNGGGGGVSSVVNISIDNGGNSNSTSNKTNTAAMAREMENSVLQIILKHQRPGGALNRA